MAGGNHYIHIYYGKKYPVICKTLYNIKVNLIKEKAKAQTAAEETSVENSSTDTYDGDAVEEKKTEIEPSDENTVEKKAITNESFDENIPKTEPVSGDIVEEKPKETKPVDENQPEENTLEPEPAKPVDENQPEENTLDPEPEPEPAPAPAPAPEPARENIVEEEKTEEELIDENEITDPEETIKFIYDPDVENINVKFISKIDNSESQMIPSRDKVFVKVLDRLFKTNMYRSVNPTLVLRQIKVVNLENVFAKAHYDDWVDFFSKRNLKKEVKAVCLFLNDHLAFRTFVSVNTFTLADVYIFFKLHKYFSSAYLKYPRYNPAFPNIGRWFRLINNMSHCSKDTEISSYLNKQYENKKQKHNARKEKNYDGKEKVEKEKKVETAKVETTKVKVEEEHLQGKKNKKVATSYAGKLENAEKGKVVTRFPPEPSGFLHIGHAKAAFLNSYYANLYEGKMLLRFDDTNPVLEDIKYENSIIEDLNNLGLKYEKITYSSEYFDLLEKYCIELITMGKAYADDTNVDEMRVQRGEGIESVNRNMTVEKSIELFEEMRKGTDIGQKNCIRAKINMKSKNKCMRDPVIYRCIVNVPHHRYQYKYKCYPTYDFACPIIDSLEGVTHALRTNEYSDRIEQYNWVLDALNLRKVYIYEFSRISFVKTVMSKRKLKWFVENQIVDGWDDPRMPTIKGILRRGLTKEALFQFILEQGPSKAGNLMQWDKLWALNKQIIDPIIPRYVAVGKNGVHLKLTDLDNAVVETKRNLHPKNADLGSCKLFYTNDLIIEAEDAQSLSKGEEITITKLGNVIITDVIKTDNDKLEILAKTNFDGDFKSTKKKIHWVPFIPEKLISCILNEYDHLITVEKLDTEKVDWKTFVNYKSKFETEVFADPELANLKVGDKLQFERRGYFILDAIKENQYYFIKIPDGKSKNMSIISTKVDAKHLAGTKDKGKK